MLHWISKVWALNDPLPLSEPDLIVLISYGAYVNQGQTHLTRGSLMTAHIASTLKKRYPQAKVVYGVFSKNPPGANEEQKLSNIDKKPICVGPVSSSTDECEAILKVAGDATSIVVVAEGWHSRRLRLVWKHFFKGNLCFCSAQGDTCADPHNPMWMQRYSLVWMLINMLLTPFYKFFPGVSWFAKQNFSQPAS